MLDLFFQMPESFLVIFFILFSIICIFISRLLTTELDNSIQYQAPELTSLTPFEMAALRDGRKGIIHTALFSFWQHQRITTSGKMQEAKISSISSKPPQNEFEQILFSFIAQKTRSPAEFFENTSLHEQLDKAIEPLNQKLEQWHLKKTPLQLQQTKKVLWVTRFLIWLIGATLFFIGVIGANLLELEFSLFSGNSEELVAIIILFLLIAFIATLVLNSQRNTQLGQQYLEELTQYYQQLKVQQFTPPGLIQLVAILGVDGLTDIDACSPFREAFSGTNCAGNTMCGGCGGCGG